MNKKKLKHSLKGVLKNTYKLIISASIDSITGLTHVNTFNLLISGHVKLKGDLVASDSLLLTDKLYFFHNLWNATLELLYEEFLPEYKYRGNWHGEITPYALSICKMLNDDIVLSDLEKDLGIMKLDFSIFDSDINDVAKKLSLDKLGFDTGLSSHLPVIEVPLSSLDHTILLIKLLYFPPLQELSWFIQRQNSRINETFQRLEKCFSNIENKDRIFIGLRESLHYSYFPIHHSTFEKYGIDGLKSMPYLSSMNSQLNNVKAISSKITGSYGANILCPCCGKEQAVTLPNSLIDYKILLENKKLANACGLATFKDFFIEYTSKISESLEKFLVDLNKVDKPDCIILVEGESEEIAIPILAFRYRYILSKEKIQVFNSGSKEKLFEDFRKISKNNPNTKIICLLDSDATREINGLKKMIADKLDKYDIIELSVGTFEDIFDRSESVRILNILLNDGDNLSVEDLDPRKTFLVAVKKALWDKKKATFDKVKFAQLIAFQMDISLLPKELEQLFALCKKFTSLYSIAKKI